MRNIEKGFTLIELMIVVAVIAILAAIAYPSYQEYVLRSRRVEGQNLLNDAAARQERWRVQNGSYLIDNADIAKLKLPHGDKSENGYYSLTIAPGSTNTADTYALRATRLNSQTADKRCGDFTLDDTGKKDMAADTPGTATDCWR